MITFDRTILHDLDRAASHEWLETNGLGGMASSTIACLNTRRYHGLLVAATQPPDGRIMLVSALEETLVLRDAAGHEQCYDLAVNHYPGALHPQGHLHLAQFRLDPYPILTYEIEGVQLEKIVFMPHGENTVCVEYMVYGLPPEHAAQLCVRPLMAFRDFHATSHENGDWDSCCEFGDGTLTMRPCVCAPALHIAHNANKVEATRHWYRNFELHAEHDRGLDWHEDLFQPFELRFELAGAIGARLIASLDVRDVNDFDPLRTSELARRSAAPAVSTKAPIKQPTDPEIAQIQNHLLRQLSTAADQFIVRRGGGGTIIAGYPWFGDWGRDTMIALPGLTLVTGRYEIARDLLRNFVRYLDRGMLPNRFPAAGGQPEYNTVDATLWMFEAVRSLLHYTGDYDFVRAGLYEQLCDVVAWHVRGTRYNIHVDDDGLIVAGEPGAQLTWMDARVGDWVVTPRTGKPVEIQALWFNALCMLRDLAVRFGDTRHAEICNAHATRARASFNAQFWNDAGQCLYDVVDGDARDGAIRPNQIFAASLHHTMLSDDRMRAVLDCVERELLTPVGLRSLSPRDSRYVAHYRGDVISRDGAYHQGTVWSWLIGPFVTAYARVHGRANARARNLLAGFVPHLGEAGLGSISEVFDADPPHTPGGCIAQAWSVAEVLRCIAEDLQ